jgi:hypothetical protein
MTWDCTGSCIACCIAINLALLWHDMCACVCAQVGRLEVVNGSTVRVYMRGSSGGGASSAAIAVASGDPSAAAAAAAAQAHGQSASVTEQLELSGAASEGEGVTGFCLDRKPSLHHMHIVCVVNGMRCERLHLSGDTVQRICIAATHAYECIRHIIHSIRVWLCYNRLLGCQLLTVCMHTCMLSVLKSMLHRLSPLCP